MFIGIFGIQFDVYILLLFAFIVVVVVVYLIVRGVFCFHHLGVLRNDRMSIYSVTIRLKLTNWVFRGEP